MLNVSSRAKGMLAPSPQSLTGRTKWNWFESIIVGLLAVVGVDVGLALITGLGLGIYSQITNLSDTQIVNFTDSIIFNFLFYGASRLIGLWLIFRFIKRRGGSWGQLGFRQFNIIKSTALLIVASLALLITSSAVFYLLNQVAPNLDLEKEQEIVFGAASSGPEVIMAFLVLVILAPIVEEVIFRGFMLPAFSQRFGVGWAVFITSLLFGFVHWQLNVGIITFMMGLLLGWLYLKTKSLVPAIMFHSLKNLVAFLLIF